VKFFKIWPLTQTHDDVDEERERVEYEERQKTVEQLRAIRDDIARNLKQLVDYERRVLNDRSRPHRP